MNDVVLAPGQEDSFKESSGTLQLLYFPAFNLYHALVTRKYPLPLSFARALSKSPQWLLQGATTFSSPLANLSHSFEFKASHNSSLPAGGMKTHHHGHSTQGLSSLIPHFFPAAMSSKHFQSPQLYSAPHSALETYPCFSPVYFFLEDSRQTSECPDHSKQGSCKLPEQAGHEDTVYI